MSSQQENADSKTDSKTERKPRKMFISIGLEAGSNLDIIWNADEQILSYKATKEGKPTKFVTTIGTYYRRSKKPKILNTFSPTQKRPTFSLDETLSAFDTVF